MGKEAIDGTIAVITAIIAVAIVAVLVSKNSSTSSVLTAGGTALSGILKAATGPVAATSAASTPLSQTGGIFTSSGQYIGE